MDNNADEKVIIENIETKEKKSLSLMDKLKSSTTFVIVIFVMGLIIWHVVLMNYFGKTIDYMNDLIEKGFYILMAYVGGNKLSDTAKSYKGTGE